jgi:hypothetical protein
MLASHETPPASLLLPSSTPWFPPPELVSGVASVNVVPGSMVPVGVAVFVVLAGVAPCPVAVVPAGIVVDFWLRIT